MRPTRLLPRLLALAATTAAAQPALTVDQITQDPGTWVGAWPEAPFWTEAGDGPYFTWNPGGAFPADSLYRVGPDGEPEKVPALERRALPPRFEGGLLEGARSETRAFTRDGDVWTYDRRTGATSRRTRTVAAETDAVVLGDGSVAFRRDDALFRMGEGGLEQLTDLRPGAEPTPADPDSAALFLRDQQRRLLGVVAERVRQDSLRTAAGGAEDGPPTFYTGARQVGQLSVDPSGRFAAFTLSDDVEAPRTLLVDYVTDSGVAQEIQARPKIGGPRVGADLFVQDLRADTTVRVDLGALPSAYVRPAASRADSSRLFLPTLRWAPSGRRAVVDVRTVDNEDRWIAVLDASTGALEVVDHQRDAAWIAGPGISWAGGVSRGGFLPDGRYVFQSEQTGWSHLYAADLDGGAVTALTEGPFEVEDAALSADGSFWILQTSEGDLGQRHLWRMPNAPDGWDRRQQLTGGVGRWDGALSPDGRRLAALYSRANRPPEVYAFRLDEAPAVAAALEAGANEPARVTRSRTDAWGAYPWRDAEIVGVPASDGARVPARIYRPRDGQGNGAAVLFVHGAGYLQNAHRWWSAYHREYQFHNLLADRGYVVLDLDYRASAGYGRDWRTAVAGHMGGRDLGDYVDASRWLEDAFGIDPERVSIYGGSYGGFITLMALFTEPEHFGSGAALRSVTDWAHYNDAYTRNILGTPLEDPEAFRRSSPIEFADGLEDPLLMTHGLVDDNVQPQDVFRLSQRLIELGKRDWELALAPVEPHGYTEPTSWADKLHRILDLVEHTVGPDRDRDDETEG